MFDAKWDSVINLYELLKLSYYGHYGNLIKQYEVSFSRMLNDILTSTSYSDFPTDQTFHQFNDRDTELDLHQITVGFHGVLATGVIC